MKNFKELEQELTNLNEKTEKIESQIRESEDSIQILGKKIVELITDGGPGADKIPILQKDRTNLQAMVRDQYLALETLESRKATAQENLIKAKGAALIEAFNEQCEQRLPLTDAIQALMDEMVPKFDDLLAIADQQDLLQFGAKISGPERFYRKKTKMIIENYLIYKLKKYLDFAGRVQFKQELSELDSTLRAKK